MSPHASTLPVIPLHDGQTVILVSAAAQSADGFNCEHKTIPKLSRCAELSGPKEASVTLEITLHSSWKLFFKGIAGMGTRKTFDGGAVDCGCLGSLLKHRTFFYSDTIIIMVVSAVTVVCYFFLTDCIFFSISAATVRA